MEAAGSRLAELLGTDDLAWLVSRARRRMADGAALHGAVTLRDPTPEERAAVDRLLGRRPSSGGTLTVRLEEVDGILRRAELCDGLADAVERLTGPVADRREAAAAEERRWREVFDAARSAVDGRPALVAWVDELAATGLVRRLAGGEVARARGLLDQAVAVVSRLPAGGVPLARLAAEATGDSHALDPGKPLATLALRAAARLASVERGPAWGAADRRAVWAAVGVLCDELSAPVLVLGLPAAGDGPTARALRDHAEHGEPCRLTLRQLVRHPPRFDPGVVHLCENPSVVGAAADRLGAACAPLVCVEGQPSVAAQTLLAALAEAGARLRYHGDFDWGGLRIANLVVDRFGAEPWRYRTADYLAAPAGRALAGRPADARWDPGLGPAMRERGAAVSEEQVLDDLLADLLADLAP